jgi:hypothetical protein
LASDEQEKIEDTNGVKLEDRKYNGQKKKNKHRCKTLHRRLKMEQHEPHKNLLDIWHRYCSSYNALTLFFEIYILPTIDTGEALRIVPR